MSLIHDTPKLQKLNNREDKPCNLKYARNVMIVQFEKVAVIYAYIALRLLCGIYSGMKNHDRIPQKRNNRTDTIENILE